MKLSTEDKKKILAAFLPGLLPLSEVSRVTKKVPGRTLIYQGRTKDNLGDQIQPGNDYEIIEERVTPINHARRVMHLMEMATDADNLTTLLAEYLVNNSKRPESND